MNVNKTDVRRKKRTGAIVGAIVMASAYGIYHCADVVGKFTGSHTVLDYCCFLLQFR